MLRHRVARFGCFAIAFSLAAIVGSTTPGQDDPPVNSVGGGNGRAAWQKLAEIGVERGALRSVKLPNAKKSYYEIADRELLASVLKDHRPLLTTALRDFLIDYWEKCPPPEEKCIAQMLLVFGQEKNDARALAHGGFYVGIHLRNQRNYKKAIAAFEAVAPEFGKLKEFDGRLPAGMRPPGAIAGWARRGRLSNSTSAASSCA